jgi:hypothetical protein
MIKRPTLLVLGAGASEPFGFPTGYDLRDRIVTMDRSRLQRHGYADRETDAFAEAFRLSGKLSIDIFLEGRRDLEKIGKLAIASLLVGDENEALLVSQFRKGPSWYQRLFDAMASPRLDNFRDNKVTFVTFNYDRSLEHFLCLALSNSHGASMSGALEQVRALPIIHVHGQLGEYDINYTTKGRPYEPKPDPEAVTLAANQIRIVHELGSDDPLFLKARAAIAEASRVYFIGFGYGATNIERLGHLPRDIHVAGSGFKLTDTERATAAERLRMHDHTRLIDANASDFLRNVPPLDS